MKNYSNINRYLILLTLVVIWASLLPVYGQVRVGPQRIQAPSAMKSKVLLLPFNKQKREVFYQVEKGGWAVMEGDILLGRDQDLMDLKNVSLAVSADNNALLWPKGVIPYTLSNSLSATQKSNAKKAIAHINSKTNITMVPRTNQKNYVEFKTHDGSACWSSLGRVGGKQTIRLEVGGCGYGTIIHEIGHTIGLWHEQSREDRNKYIQILYANIKDGKAKQFKQHIEDGVDIGKYDYGSIMHYKAKAFTKNGKPTIKSKIPGKAFGQRSGLSSGDIAAINKMYPTDSKGNYKPGYKQIAKHQVPESSYQALVEKLVKNGYQLEWADFYEVKGKVFVNPLFRPKTGKKWLARHNQTSAQYQAVFNKYVPLGYRATHVESYTKNGQIRYALVMEKKSGALWKAYHGRTATQHQQLLNSYSKQGYKPVNMSVVSIKGKRYYTALYQKKDVGSWQAKSFLTSAQYQAAVAANKKAGRKLAYLAAYTHNGSPYFSAIWQAKVNGSWQAKHNLDATQYQSQFNKWTGQGYATDFVTGYASGGSHRFAAQWRKH